MPNHRTFSRLRSHLVVAACSIVVGMLASSVILHASPLFKAPHYLLEPGRAPTSVAIADLNEDGRPDLAVTHGDYAPPAVAVFLGNGDGTFGSRTDFEVGMVPRAVRAAHLDADGHLDLAVANGGNAPDSPSTITVLLGLGDGTFAPRADFEVEKNTRALAIADLDADGALDLVTENSVLLGNGNGTFGARIGFGDDQWGVYQSVAVGDLDGDGRPDVVTGNAYINDDDEDDFTAISVHLGQGAGTFAAPVKLGTGFHVSAVAVADLNADGRVDVAASNRGSSPDENGYVSVFLGNGNGTLQVQRRFDTGNNPTSIAIADIDADGRVDVATCNAGDDPDFDSNTITVLLGNGDGTFRETAELNVGQDPAAIAIGDLDGNGALDLVTADEGSHTVSVVLGNGGGTFGIPEYGVGQWPRSLATADVDGDGSMDLAVASAISTTVSVLLGNGDGSFGARADFTTGGFPYSVAISDLDADGRSDLVVANWVDYTSYLGTVSVLLGNGDGTFQPKVDYPAGITPGSVVVADLNADGRVDMAVPNTPANSSTNTISVLLGNGDGTFGPRTVFATDGGPWSLAVADLNEDTRLDIVSANYGSPSTVSVLLGNGDGTFLPGTTVPTGSFAHNTQLTTVVDLDADGHTDVIAGRMALLGKGDGTFASPIAFANGPPEFMAMADFDADGQLDLATATPGFDYLAGEVGILLGNGNGTFAHPIRFGTGRFPHSPVAADLDGDGRPDLAVANFQSNSVSVLLNRADQPTPTLVTLVSAHVARDLVELTWSDASGDVSSATVYRRTVRDNWQPIGEIMADGTGKLVYEDRTVIPGTRYGYRLGVRGRQEVFLGETWVDVPTSLQLALAGFRSNPVRDDFSVAFTLPTDLPARLEMFDLCGRRVAAHDVGALGAGSHVITLGKERRPAPGVYLLRLAQGTKSLTSRAVILQ